jgi:hypothetical protein
MKIEIIFIIKFPLFTILSIAIQSINTLTVSKFISKITV